MAHTGIFNIAEVLEQILYFLVVDKFLYPTLFVYQLWYRYGASILWKCIELKKNEVENKSQLKRFLKTVYREQRLKYSLKLTHFKISHYHLFSNKKLETLYICFQI